MHEIEDQEIWQKGYALSRQAISSSPGAAYSILEINRSGPSKRQRWYTCKRLPGGRFSVVSEGWRHCAVALSKNSKPPSERYLSFAVRYEIAILYAQEQGVCEIASRLM